VALLIFNALSAFEAYRITTISSAAPLGHLTAIDEFASAVSIYPAFIVGYTLVETIFRIDLPDSNPLTHPISIYFYSILSLLLLAILLLAVFVWRERQLPGFFQFFYSQ
jgi:hypothetical protein